MFTEINWEELINKRRSTRSFVEAPIESEKKAALQKFVDEMKVPFDHSIKVRYFKARPGKKLYTMMNAPLDNLAIIGETDFVSISKAGFVGELAVLYATHMGLSTCWFGHYNLSELEENMPHLGLYKNDSNPKWGYGKSPVEGRRTICITPIAHYKEKGVRLVDRLQKVTMSFKRKPLGELINQTVESLPKDLFFALDLARKAPSGGNSQSWQFDISKDFKTITLAMPVGYKHIKWEHPNVDIGICASHFWLGLNLRNIESTVTVKEDQGRAVWAFTVKD